LKHLEKRCRIKRKLFAHYDRTRVCKGESLVGHGNADRLVTKIETGHGLSRFKMRGKVFDFNYVQDLRAFL
jgi:hypothetical protein